jgi:hypothetical protein
MEAVKDVLADDINEMIEQAEKNADRYISISNNEGELITGSTVFIEQ